MSARPESTFEQDWWGRGYTAALAGRPVAAVTIAPGDDPEAFADRCEAHGSHHPLPVYLEAHHVVPRAWQHLTRENARAAGADGLWLPETVLLCRTGHGNVHYWIEAMMRAYDGSIDEAFAAAVHGSRRGGREHDIARDALAIFTREGGDLMEMKAAGALGGIYGQPSTGGDQ